MKKLLPILILSILMIGCSVRTEITPECKNGVLYYTYEQTYVDSWETIKKYTGILTYKDGSIVKCVKEK